MKCMHIPEMLTNVRADPVSPRLRAMVWEVYDEFGFPDDRKHFGNVAIYLRRTVTISAD